MRSIQKTYEASHGPMFITGENRDALKPFVLFDAGSLESEGLFGPSWHPHSGVATLTFPYISELHHSDSAGHEGVVREGGFQWMQAGGGLWHQEKYLPRDGRVGIQQLWVQLPPSEESGPPLYFDVQPEEVAVAGNTRVFLGSHAGITSAHDVAIPMTYLDVTLADGEAWSHSLPEPQRRAFLFVREGRLEVGGASLFSDRLAHLDEGVGAVEVAAEGATSFVLVAAAPSPYPVVHSYGQIHTRASALVDASRQIREIGDDMKRRGIVR